MEKQTQKISIWRIFAYFIIYSFVGFVVETLFALINYNVLESRKSFLYGPFCGIYGVGAVALIIVLKHWFNKNNYTLFFGGCITGSAIEYVMSFLGEIFFNARWWDYSNRFLNVNGRICLLYALFWGILRLILMKMINPYVDKFISFIQKKLKPKAIKWIISIAIFFMLINIIATGLAVELFLIRMSTQNNLDIKHKEEATKIYNAIYQNQDKRNFINKFWGNKKMLTTFPNITITTKTGEVIRVKELLPEIKPYIYKFEGK